MDIAHTIEDLARAARSDRLVLFLGSGISRPYGLPDWAELAGSLGVGERGDRDRIPDKFERYVAAYGWRALHELLESRLGRRPARVLETTRLILQTRCTALVTTNADRILETAARLLGAPMKVFVSDDQLEEFHSTPWLRLIKLHGSLDRKDLLVFTRSQYDAHEQRVPGIRRQVAELLKFCHVLFIGFSLADPGLYEIVELASDSKPGHLPPMVGLFPQREIDDKWRRRYLDERLRSAIPLLEIPFESLDVNPTGAVEKFLVRLRDRVSPLFLPVLSEQCIIMTCGYTATLKSETSVYLANCLGVPLMATHQYGRCTNPTGVLDSSLRSVRYEHLIEDAEAALARGHSVVLDGTFSDRLWRTRVYKLAGTFDARVVVLLTSCEDEGYIRARLWRRLDHSRSEHEVTKIDNYYITRQAIEKNPAELDDVPENVRRDLVRFSNNGERVVQTVGQSSADAELVCDLIRISPLMSAHI